RRTQFFHLRLCLYPLSKIVRRLVGQIVGYRAALLLRSFGVATILYRRRSLRPSLLQRRQRDRRVCRVALRSNASQRMAERLSAVQLHRSGCCLELRYRATGSVAFIRGGRHTFFSPGPASGGPGVCRPAAQRDHPERREPYGVSVHAIERVEILSRATAIT